MQFFEWLTESIKDVIDYYEEKCLPLEEFFKKHEILNVLFIGLIFTVIYLPCYLYTNDTESWHTSEANSTKRHLTQSDLIEIFPANHKLRSIFSLLGNRIEFPPSQTPLAIVLAGTNFAKEELKFKEISNKHFWMENITLHSNPEMSESKLFNEVNKALEKYDGKAFVFIEDIDKLSGRAPLVLQTLTDVDASKYKESVYILTVNDNEIDKSMNEKECTEMITRKLQNAWSSSLHSDQINPIISRITGITVCLS